MHKGFQLYEKTAQYRTLQVLGILMNEIQQKFLITSLVIAATLILSCGMTVVVQMPFTKGNLLQLSVFLVLMTDSALLLIVILGNMSKVLVQSHRIFEVVRTHMTTQKISDRKQMEKFLKSCNFVKVRFGTLNYIDSLTPIKCIDFANDLTVQLLLIN